MIELDLKGPFRWLGEPGTSVLDLPDDLSSGVYLVGAEYPPASLSTVPASHHAPSPGGFSSTLGST